MFPTIRFAKVPLTLTCLLAACLSLGCTSKLAITPHNASEASNGRHTLEQLANEVAAESADTPAEMTASTQQNAFLWLQPDLDRHDDLWCHFPNVVR